MMSVSGYLCRSNYVFHFAVHTDDVVQHMMSYDGIMYVSVLIAWYEYSYTTSIPGSAVLRIASGISYRAVKYRNKVKRIGIYIRPFLVTG